MTYRHIKLKIKKQNTCPGEIIGTYCYELVASAEYNTPGDIDLISSTGARIPRPSSGNVNLNTCWQAANPNGSVTWGTGNCGWTTTWALASMYNYTASKITDFNPIKSWLTYDGQSGIVIENVGDPDYLPYDISSLNLWDDWAIEMSVRGEDLRKRSPTDTNTYYLFNSPGSFSIYSWRWESWFYDLLSWNTYTINTSSETNWYKNMT